MTESVLNWSRAGFSAISATASASYERLALKVPSRELVTLGVILAILQILDGVLTGIGVSMLGTGMEGNFILRSMMESWGHMTALIVVKTFAIGVVASLTVLATIVPWLKQALRAMIVLYLVAAVIPWTAILLGELG